MSTSFLGVKCWLRSNYNYITSSQKEEPPFYWKGLYKCIKCKSEFRCYIKDEPIEFGFMVVSWPEIAGEYHDRIKKENV